MQVQIQESSATWISMKISVDDHPKTSYNCPKKWYFLCL